MAKRSTNKAKLNLELIAKKLKEGVPYESLLADLDDTLGIKPSQEPNEVLDKDWEESYRKSKV